MLFPAVRLPPWLPWLQVTVNKAFGGTGLKANATTCSKEIDGPDTFFGRPLTMMLISLSCVGLISTPLERPFRESDCKRALADSSLLACDHLHSGSASRLSV